jgi:hypothetical protein
MAHPESSTIAPSAPAVDARWHEPIERLVRGQGLDSDLAEELERNAALRDAVDARFRAETTRLADVAKAMRAMLDEDHVPPREEQQPPLQDERRLDTWEAARGLVSVVAGLFSRPAVERAQVVEAAVTTIEGSPEVIDRSKAITALREIAKV